MKILITGGAGFIGTNTALFFLENGHDVTILDNFSRKGTPLNAQHIAALFPKVKIITADIRDASSIKQYIKENEVIIHLAGQVAVTTSIKDPRYDFEVNVLGTFNILEQARLAKHKPLIIYSSTNKVYGNSKGTIKHTDKRYIDITYPNGISEQQPLDFYSPYGCSKGAADQYVRDYARIYDIPTLVFRQSCIYGEHQFGIEDQGWLAHFVIKALQKNKITIYGTGYQVRDILYISDLIEAYEAAIKCRSKVAGEIFNIGGGKENTISLLESIEELKDILHTNITTVFKDKRPGDQDVYISDNSKLKEILHWQPKTNKGEGIMKLVT